MLNGLRMSGWVLVSSLTVLAGCGGGGGDSASTPAFNPDNTVVLGAIVSGVDNPSVGGATPFSVKCSGGQGTLSYAWDFGDGTTATSGAKVTHAYADMGRYTVSVSCTDKNARSRSSSLDVSVIKAVTGGSFPQKCTGTGSAGWCASSPLLTSISLRGLRVVDPNTIWVLGSDGRLLLTTDAGSNWSRLSLNFADGDADLRAIAPVDANSVWAVNGAGRLIYIANSATDGLGATLFYPFAAKTAQSLRAVGVVDAKTVWAVGANGVIVRTDDAGQTWTTQAANTSQTLNGLAIIDTHTAYAVGDNGTIVKTVDGGAHWVPQSSGTTQALLDIAMQTDKTGVVVGAAGTVLQTIDAGNTWTARNSGTTQNLTAVSKLGTAQFVAVGTGVTDASADSAIIASADGGASWALQSSGVSQPLRTVAALGSAFWVMGDAGTFLSNVNAGKWEDQHFATGNFAAFAAQDAYSQWVFGRDGTLFKTTDGGATWAMHKTVVSGVTSLVVADSVRAWATDTFGTVYATSDGGQSWTVLRSDLSHPLLAFAVTGMGNSVQTLWGVGTDAAAAVDKGYFVKSVDGGKSWTSTHLPGQSLTGLAVVDDTHAWAIGTTTILGQTVGAIYLTADGGVTWSAVTWNNNSAQTPSAIIALDGATAWVTTYDPTGHAKSQLISVAQVNGFISASALNLPTTQRLSAISFDSADQLAWIVGYDPAGVAQSAIYQVDLNGTNPSFSAQPSGTTQALLGVQVLDKNTVFSLTGTALLKTTTAGSQ